MRVRGSGLALLVMLAACGDDGSNGLPAAGAGAGGLPATAGIGGTTAGVGAGGAGMTGAGTGGVTGGAGAGAGGSAAGMGGAMAGVGGAMAGSGGSMSGDTGAPTWTAVFNEIIAGTGCNGGISCHQGAVGGMLAMPDKDTAYMNLVGKAAAGTNLGVVPMGAPHCKDVGMTRVVAGQPDMSLIVKKVEMAVPPCGGPMPPDPMPPALSMAKRQQLRTWIMMGAKND